jgi:hypothetical protein
VVSHSGKTLQSKIASLSFISLSPAPHDFSALNWPVAKCELYYLYERHDSCMTILLPGGGNGRGESTS